MLLAPVQLCTPRPSARDRDRAAEDLQQLLQVVWWAAGAGRMFNMHTCSLKSIGMLCSEPAGVAFCTPLRRLGSCLAAGSAWRAC